jgi:hypothetical protein
MKTGLLRGIRQSEKPFRWDALTVDEAKIEAADKARRQARRAKGTPESFRLEYTGPDKVVGIRVHLVPLLEQPIFVHHPATPGKDECPTCQIIHPVKTHHLWLDSSNRVLVSRSVYESILGDVGLEMADLKLVDGTNRPPPLAIGAGKSRREIDQENEAITHY